MKKLLSALLFISSFTYAQNSQPQTQAKTGRDSVKTKTSFISFNAGVSVPLLDYGSTHSTQSFMLRIR